jgi:hypothetical protein
MPYSDGSHPCSCGSGKKYEQVSRQANRQLNAGEEPKMTENEYYTVDFTDTELNCQAYIADYRRAVEEFFFEHEHHMDQQKRAAFRRSNDRQYSIV